MTAVGAIQSLIRENSALNQKLKTVEASVESVQQRLSNVEDKINDVKVERQLGRGIVDHK